MPIIRDFTQKDNILVFDSHLDDRSNYNSTHLVALKNAENNHFWFSARRKKICQKFKQYVDKNSSILEIGGGSGYVAEKLAELGFSIEMSDIYQNGLHFAKQRGIKKLYQFDLFNPPFHKEYDVICLFDVLEHLKDEVQAFKCIKSMLKPGGKIILTVPAHQWLWSRDDVIAGHERRYTKNSLEEVLLKAHIQPLEICYFFSSIVPFLLLRRWVRSDNKKPLNNEISTNFSINPFINHLLSSLTKSEFILEKYLPNIMGGSLLAVGRT